jgi:hypothetical protein
MRRIGLVRVTNQNYRSVSIPKGIALPGPWGVSNISNARLDNRRLRNSFPNRADRTGAGLSGSAFFMSDSRQFIHNLGGACVLLRRH